MRLILVVLTLSLVLVLSAACAEVPLTPLSETRPSAQIDSVSASDINEGQAITFSGHGTDLGGTIVAYSWRSSIDGNLNAFSSFSTSNLSIGTHNIYFKVQNNRGEWSKEAGIQVNVYPAQASKPFIFLFTTSSAYIEPGSGVNLEWKVSGASTVSIQPDIGNVPLAGNRLVSPAYDTNYTLIATNISGSVTRTVNIIVVPVEIKTIQLFSVPADEGFVTRFGEAGNTATAGITATGIPYQAFFSFDLAPVPPGSKIVTASLDLSQFNMHGYPFEALGKFGVFQDDYIIPLKPDKFAFAFTIDGLVLADEPPIRPFMSASLAQTVQKQIDSGKTRLQMRGQFAKFDYSIYGSGENYLEFNKGKTKITLRYR